MPEISVDEDSSDAEVGEAPRAGPAVPSGTDGRRGEDGDSGNGVRGGGGGRGGVLPLAAPGPLEQSALTPASQQRPRVEPPPYYAVLFLWTEHYRLRGVSTSDLADDCLERLRETVWSTCGRHLVGASVRPGSGGGGSLDVTLDTAEVFDGAGGAPSTWISASAPLSIARRQAATGGMERRKAAAAGGAGGGGTGAGREGCCGLSAAQVEAALLRRGWLRPRAWAVWARLFAAVAAQALAELGDHLWTLTSDRGRARSHARTRSGFAAAASRREAGSAADERGIVAGRITAVAPRAMVLQRATADAADLTGPVSSAPAPSPGPACLRVSAAVCCSGSPSDVAGRDGRRPPAARAVAGAAPCAGSSNRGGGGGGGDDGSGPQLEVLLRQGSGFASVCALSTEAPEPGAAAPGLSGQKAGPCRRPQCRRHLTLRQDVQLNGIVAVAAAAAGSSAAEVAAAPVPSAQRTAPVDGLGGALGPGLLLLDARPMCAAESAGGQRWASSGQQRGVPVVVLDDPWVGRELQAALSDKQVEACGGGGGADELLIDLGVFLTHIAELRAAAAPVLALADAGMLRRAATLGSGPLRCSCRDRPRPGGSDSSVVSQERVACPHYPGAAAEAASPCVAAASPAPSAVCVPCMARRLRDGLLGRALCTSVTQYLGENLLRHATCASCPRTASYISSCLVDLQRIDVLTDVVLGPKRWEELGVQGNGGAGARAAQLLSGWRRVSKRFVEGFFLGDVGNGAAAPKRQSGPEGTGSSSSTRCSVAASSSAGGGASLRWWWLSCFWERGARPPGRWEMLAAAGLRSGAWRLQAVEHVAVLLVSYGLHVLMRAAAHLLRQLVVAGGLPPPTPIAHPMTVRGLLSGAFMAVGAFCIGRELLLRFAAGVLAVRLGGLGGWAQALDGGRALGRGSK